MSTNLVAPPPPPNDDTPPPPPFPPPVNFSTPAPVGPKEGNLPVYDPPANCSEWCHVQWYNSQQRAVPWRALTKKEQARVGEMEREAIQAYWEQKAQEAQELNEEREAEKKKEQKKPAREETLEETLARIAREVKAIARRKA